MGKAVLAFVDAGMASEVGETLSLSNGVRCVTDSNTAVEAVLIAIADQVGGGNIVSASRMNKAVVVFLNQVALVTKIVVSGIWVNGVFVQVTPLLAPATKVVISNIPPFVKNEQIERELMRFGKLAGKIKTIPLGCKNADLKHVLSFRRQIYMFLSSNSQSLDISFRVRHGESSYVIYASSENLRCFECGDVGHLKRSCPHNKEKLPSETPNEQAENRVDLAVQPQCETAALVEADERNQDGLEGVLNVGTEESTVAPGAEKPAEPEAQCGGQMSKGDPMEGTSEYTKFILETVKTARNEGKHKIDIIDSAQSIDQSSGKKKKKCRTEKEPVFEKASVHDSGKSDSGQPPQLHLGSGATDPVGLTDTDCAAISKQLDKGLEDDAEMSDSSVYPESMPSQEGDVTLYSFAEINDFLDVNKGKAVNALNFFPDADKFTRSVKHIMNTASLSELSSQKRFRLKKYCTAVRKLKANLRTGK